MVKGQYSVVWDTCCDHGQLGASLLKRYRNAGEGLGLEENVDKSQTINFVDIGPEIIQELNNNLQTYFGPPNSTVIPVSWQTYCMSTTELPLKSSQYPQLIIIAGVGGDLMSDMVDAILKRCPQLDLHFLLCPVHHQTTLRKTLRQHKCTLLEESLVMENKRVYECILVSSDNGRVDTNKKVDSAYKTNPVSLIGEAIWQIKSEKEHVVALNYASKRFGHYKRTLAGMNQNDSPAIEEAQFLLEQYQQVLTKLSLKLYSD